MTKTTIQVDAVKIFKSRDSATSLLRKLGINSRDYNLFIEKMTDGQFACKVAMAEMHIESLKNPKPAVVEEPKAKVAKAGRRAADPVVQSKPKKMGISATARELILSGKTNQEVWEVLKQQFNLDDSKKHYPTWYRCEMKRTGLLPKGE
jgi:hypothetical protein